MTAMLELYGAQTGNCLRAAIALEEAGISYLPRGIDLALGEHRKTRFLALNPAGKVPVLVRAEGDQPFVLTQSNAIISFADSAAPGTILPTSGRSRQVAVERYFYFLTDVIGPAHAAFSLRGADMGSARALLLQRAVAAMRTAEQFIGTSAYMAGDAFTVADIAAFTITSSFGPELPWPDLPHLYRWFQTVAQRPSVLRGSAAFAG